MYLYTVTISDNNINSRHLVCLLSAKSKNYRK